MDISLSGMLDMSPDYLITLILYVGLGATYLLVAPGLTIFYLNRRWYAASSVERLLMYFAVFFFFPGLLLLSPFIFYRPQPPKA